MGDGFSVTPGELMRIGGRLDGVHDDLAAAGDHTGGVQAHRDALGHDGLAGVLDSFETNWSLMRHELAGSVRSLAAAARDAAQSYRETDDSIGTSFGTSTPVR